MQCSQKHWPIKNGIILDGILLMSIKSFSYECGGRYMGMDAAKGACRRPGRKGHFDHKIGFDRPPLVR